MWQTFTEFLDLEHADPDLNRTAAEAFLEMEWEYRQLAQRLRDEEISPELSQRVREHLIAHGADA